MPLQDTFYQLCNISLIHKLAYKYHLRHTYLCTSFLFNKQQGKKAYFKGPHCEFLISVCGQTSKIKPNKFVFIVYGYIKLLIAEEPLINIIGLFLMEDTIHFSYGCQFSWSRYMTFDCTWWEFSTLVWLPIAWDTAMVCLFIILKCRQNKDTKWLKKSYVRHIYCPNATTIFHHSILKFIGQKSRRWKNRQETYALSFPFMHKTIRNLRIYN